MARSGTSLSREVSRNSASGPNPTAELVDQRRDVARRRLGPQPGRQSLRAQFVGTRTRERHHLDAKPGIDPLDAHRQHPFEVARIAGRARGADPEPLLAAVNQVAGEHARAQAEPAGGKEADEIVDEVADDLGDRFGGDDRLEQAACGQRHFEWGNRHDRLGEHAAGLVQTCHAG
jgi:hypothetical protein